MAKRGNVTVEREPVACGYPIRIAFVLSAHSLSIREAATLARRLMWAVKQAEKARG